MNLKIYRFFLSYMIRNSLASQCYDTSLKVYHCQFKMNVQVNEAVVTGWLFFRYLVIGGRHKHHKTLFAIICFVYMKQPPTLHYNVAFNMINLGWGVILHTHKYACNIIDLPSLWSSCIFLFHKCLTGYPLPVHLTQDKFKLVQHLGLLGVNQHLRVCWNQHQTIEKFHRKFY